MIYTTTDFDGQRTKDYTLLIGVGAEDHRVAVVDGAKHLKFAASYRPDDVEAEEIRDVLNGDYASVKLAIADSRYMLIPADIYDDQQRETYLSYLPFDGVGTTQVADISPLGVKLLHQTNRVGWGVLTTRHPHMEPYPQVQSLLSAVAARAAGESAPLVVVERHAPWITIGLFDGVDLLYCHDFESAGEDDFTYHVLAVLHQFGWVDRQPNVLLAGDIEHGDSYYERAAAYGGKVIFADSTAFTGVQVPNDMLLQQHRFLSLFGLYLCGS